MGLKKWTQVSVVVLLLAGALVDPKAAHADIIEFLALLDGDQADCDDGTCDMATGTGTFVLDTDTGRVDFEIEFTLCNTELAAHVHTDPACNVGRINYILPPGSPKIGFAIISPEQQVEMITSLHNVIIHSDVFPAGELRGQILPVEPNTHFVRGDCNTDDQVNIADAIFELGFLFGDLGAPVCQDACDVNDDGQVNIADVIYLLSNLFSMGSDPAEPFPNCGDDPTADGLDCVFYAPCP